MKKILSEFPWHEPNQPCSVDYVDDEEEEKTLLDFIARHGGRVVESAELSEQDERRLEESIHCPDGY